MRQIVYFIHYCATQEVSSLAWVAAAAQVLAAAGTQPSRALQLPVFPLPFQVDPLHITCFPTLHLTARFLEHLAWSAEQGRSTTSKPTTVIDAFVHAVHGPRRLGEPADALSECDKRCNWECVLGLFPAALRGVLQCAVKQCNADVDPTWPYYVLEEVGREDLGGKLRLAPCAYLWILAVYADVVCCPV
jgi:hypothetical protein